MSQEEVREEEESAEKGAEIQPTGFVSCPVCDAILKSKGKYGHFKTSHPELPYPDYRDKFRPAKPLEPEKAKEGEPLYKGELDTTNILKGILTKHPDIPSKVVDEVCSWAEYGPIHPTQLVSLLQSFRGITATTAYIVAQKYALALQKAQQEGKLQMPPLVGGPMPATQPPQWGFPTGFPQQQPPTGLAQQQPPISYAPQPFPQQTPFPQAPSYQPPQPWYQPQPSPQPQQDVRSIIRDELRLIEERRPKEVNQYVDVEEPVRDSEGKVIIGPDDRPIMKRMRLPASQAGQYQPYPLWQQRPEDVGSVVKKEIDDMKKYVDTKLETLRPREEGYVEISEPLRTPEGKAIVDSEGNPLVRTVRAPVSQASQIALGGDPELRFLEKMKHYKDLFGKEELTPEKVRSIIKEEVPKEKGVEAKPVTPEEVQKAVAEASTKAAQTVLAEVKKEDKEERRHHELLDAIQRGGESKVVEGYKQDAYRFLGQGMGEVARVAEKKEPIKIIIQGARDILAGPPPKEVEKGAREDVLSRLPPEWVTEE